jgi:hypothetical protein
MLFCDVGSGRSRSKDYEKLAIFGDVRARRGAELKVLSAVETKVPGYYAKIKNEVLDRDRKRDATGTWDSDTMSFQDDELSFALGKQGATRKKTRVLQWLHRAVRRSHGRILRYLRAAEEGEDLHEVALCST